MTVRADADWVHVTVDEAVIDTLRSDGVSARVGVNTTVVLVSFTDAEGDRVIADAVNEAA